MRHNKTHSAAWREWVAASTALCFALQPTLAFALPAGGVVSGGAATITGDATSTTITQSSGRAIIDWNSFDVSQGESVHFAQPDAGAITFNRINDSKASLVDGSLTANGNVWFSNAHGMVFGNHAQVNVGGLIATTADMDNNRFMAGQSVFDVPGDANASIVNHGTIHISDYGMAALVAPNVTNTGTINARLGKVQLASGDTFTIDPYGDGLINLQASAALANMLVENSGSINADGGTITLSLAAAQDTLSHLVNLNGLMAADTITVDASDGTLMHTGEMEAREVTLSGRNIAQQGSITGTDQVEVNFTGRYIDSAASKITGKNLHLHGSAGSGIFTSGYYDASGPEGGNITFEASDIKLYAATLDASGDTAGGHIIIGGGPRGTGDMLKAETVTLNPYTTLLADAREAGNGGTVTLWSEKDTRSAATIHARGGSQSGDGGSIEISSAQSYAVSGDVSASAAHGAAGQLLIDPKNIIIDTGGANNSMDYFPLVDPNAADGFGFSTQLTVLTNGNVVFSKPDDTFGGSNAGAVYLFNGATGALISSLRGSNVGDSVGGSIYTLTNGNYVVRSYQWNGNRGAVTWGSGTAGVTGTISSANSLVGSSANDSVSGNGIYALTNGNYVVGSSLWNGNRGAVTWGSGTSGVTGTISSANSLVGSSVGDNVSSSGIYALTNGNYVVSSNQWNGGRGAATWGSGTAGITGTISSANSLVGSSVGDNVGNGITALTNGNYVVSSALWNGNRGAATWGSGTAGVTGTISSANSLVGSSANDSVSGNGIYALTNGNYVVGSSLWNGNRGAVTWGSGTAGVTGTVSSANSLVGSSVGDNVSSNGIYVLTNGNYVIRSNQWNGTRGAVTWGSGTAGVTGTVSSANSLVGSSVNDYVGGGGITALTNGNYVVNSYNWNVTRGAATWGSGTAGVVGTISSANSLVGSSVNDYVANSGITALTNGNYVVTTGDWNGGRGAATWGSGTMGITGTISSANSLVGTSVNDRVGIGGIAALTNGNYVVRSSQWDGNRGAATWGSGTAGITGTVSSANSLVGSNVNDYVGIGGIAALTNGNYVVNSSQWNGNRGAATWSSGTAGVVGTVSSANSLVGSSVNDYVANSGITALTNGNYVVGSNSWNSSRGAATWGSGTAGVVGTISSSNSLVGSSANDSVTGGGITALTNGNYVIFSTALNGTDLAFTLADGTAASSGTVSAVNSVIVANPSMDDPVNSFVQVIPGTGRLALFFKDSNIVGSAYSASTSLATPSSYTYAFRPEADVTLHPDFLTNVLNAGTNVVLQANNDITVNNDITTNNPGGNGGALTLQAGRSILLNANITTDNGNLNLYANEKAATGVVDAYRDAGTAVISMAAGTSINAGTGAVNIRLDDGLGNTNRSSGDISLRDITAGSITAQNVQNTGDIVLNGTLTASSAGNALTLASGRNFINNAGAGALSAGAGRWLVYSTNPAQDTLGGLTPVFTRGSSTYAGYPPGSVTLSGNGLLYSTALSSGVSSVSYHIPSSVTLPSSNLTSSQQVGGTRNEVYLIDIHNPNKAGGETHPNKPEDSTPLEYSIGNDTDTRDNNVKLFYIPDFKKLLSQLIGQDAPIQVPEYLKR